MKTNGSQVVLKLGRLRSLSPSPPASFAPLPLSSACRESTNHPVRSCLRIFDGVNTASSGTSFKLCEWPLHRYITTSPSQSHARFFTKSSGHFRSTPSEHVHRSEIAAGYWNNARALFVASLAGLTIFVYAVSSTNAFNDYGGPWHVGKRRRGPQYGTATDMARVRNPLRPDHLSVKDEYPQWEPYTEQVIFARPSRSQDDCSEKRPSVPMMRISLLTAIPNGRPPILKRSLWRSLIPSPLRKYRRL